MNGTRIQERIADALRVCSLSAVLLFSADLLTPIWAWVAVVLAAISLLGRPVREVRFEIIDYAVIGLWAFELLSLRFSTYPSNGWAYIELLAIAASTYFSISRLESVKHFHAVCALIVALAVTTTVRDAAHFSERYAVWRQLRFGSLGDVRQALTTVSGPAGAHYAIYLCLLAWGFAVLQSTTSGSRFWRIAGGVTVGASLVGVSLSLSRGVYFGLLVGLIFGYLARQWRNPGSISSLQGRSAVFGLFILGAVFWSVQPARGTQLLETAPTETSPGERSVHGRFQLWEKALMEVRRKPWFGFGARTFPLYGASGLTQDGQTPVERAFSLPVQLLFERGVLGTVFYGVFFLCVFLGIARQIRRFPTEGRVQERSGSWAPVVGITGLLAHDLTYTTLFDDKAVTVGLFLLLGLVAAEARRNGERTFSESRFPISSVMTLFLLLVLLTITGWQRVQRVAAEWYAEQAAEEESQNSLEAAVTDGMRALSASPDPYLRAQVALFLARSARLHTDARGAPYNVSIGTAEAIVAAAEQHYEESLDAFPNEAGWQHNLGWLRWVSGDLPSAGRLFRRSIELEPGTALYRQSLISLLLSESKTESARREITGLLVRAPEVLDSPWWESVSSQQEQAAESALESAIASITDQADPDPILLSRAARLYAEVGKFDLSKTLLEKALRLQPSMSGAWRNYGLILARRGEWALGAQALERDIFLNPWDSAGYYALSRVVPHLESATPVQERNLHIAADAFLRDAVRVQRQRRSSEASQRAWRQFGIHSPVPDDLVIEGLLDFCLPDIRRQFEFQ